MRAIPPAMTAGACTVPVAIYTRVSTANQVGGRFDSCESQAAVCRDYIRTQAAEGWFEVACFSDPAYSGSSMNRPGIQALKRQIEAGSVRIVLIFKLERVLRSTDEWGPFRTFLQKHGCKLVSPTEDLSDDTPSGRLKNNLMMSVAEYERLNTAEKIRIKLNEQAKRGFWTGGQVPFGYLYDEATQGLTPHPDEAPILQRIFKLASQLVPLTEIANTINEEGIRTRARIFRRRDGSREDIGKKRFRSDILRRLIKRPLYAGRVRMNGQEYPGQHQALVTSELWDQANAVIAKSLKPARRQLRTRDKHFHVLKGIVHCGCCGRTMIPNASGKLAPDGKPYRYYTCGYAHKEGPEAACPVRHVSATALELAVTGFLGKCGQHPEVIAATIESARRHRQADRTPLREKLTGTEHALDALAAQLRNCAQTLALGGLASLDDLMRDQIAHLQDKKQRLLVEREHLRRELAACEQGDLEVERIRQSLSRFGELLPSLSQEQQRDLLLLFVERIEVRPCASARVPQDAPAGIRFLDLRLKLRVGHLVEGMEERLVIEQRIPSPVRDRPERTLAIPVSVTFAPAGSRAPVSLLAPFPYDLGVARRAASSASSGIAPAPAQHAIHRARAWARDLADTPGFTRVKLAARENISPGAVTHCMKLLLLADEIQTFLLGLTCARDVRRYSFTRMQALAEFPLDEQRRRFALMQQG
ncbi:site-specific recombinase, DNA invertase Pin [Opitutaceae bacterium TAV1]|nr:site-specific recombinase, DNA invertase Pin [Opitutaceae bacterium TAV1]